MAKEEKKIEALVLSDCFLGKCGEVVTVAAELVQSAVDYGMIDTNPAAIKAAKG